MQQALEAGTLETPKPGDAAFNGHAVHLIATPQQSLEAAAALARSAQAAQEQHRVAVSQHRAGAASPVQLLVADQVLLQARSNLAAAQAQRLLDTVALGAALAGETVLGQNPQVPLRHPQE